MNPLFVIAFVTLTVTVGGCGPPSFENVNSQPSRPSSVTESARDPKPVDDPKTSTPPPTTVKTVPVPVPENPAETPVEEEAEKTAGFERSMPGVPEAILHDLSSSDPSTRLRALDHWAGTEVQAPMELVFQAMEDEDEDVRVKATALVEQRWAENEKKGLPEKWESSLSEN